MQKSRQIKLIFGLGNPEGKYLCTRHNFGRDLVTSADSRGPENKITSLNFSEYSKFDKLVLCWGKVFVNESGKAIAELKETFKLKPDEIMIVHDEADLPFLWIKISYGKKSAGHKGVESVKKVLKTWDFWRFRIGIQGKRRKPAADIILKKLTPSERKLFDKAQNKFKEILQKLAWIPPEKLNIPQKFFIG